MKAQRFLCVALCLLVIFSYGITFGVDYPQKETTFINPFNPGGEVDIYFRIVQPHLEKALGVRIIPEYKPAAGGAVAWSFLAAAKPDGYTIGGFSLPHVILQPWFIKDTKFTPDDFTYLNMLAYTPIGLAVKNGFPAKTLKEFIEYAKANPNKVTVGVVGKHSGHHLATLQFMKLTGTKLIVVPFTGTAPQKTAILGGHIDAVMTNSTAMVETRPAGVIPLAIGSETRMEQLSDVPTFAELGFKFYPRIDRGFFAPKNLSTEVTDKLEKTLFEIVSSKEVQSKLVQLGFVPKVMNRAALTKYVNDLSIELKKLVEEEKLISDSK